MSTAPRSVPHFSVLGLIRNKTGAVIILIVSMMVAIFGMAALVLDLGHIQHVKLRLQITADASALAAVREIPNSFAVKSVAITFSQENYPGYGLILDEADVVLGQWDFDNRQFSPGQDGNAVKVTTKRYQERSNAVPQYFTPVLGLGRFADVQAVAIAVMREGIGARFLFDEDLIDSDVPVIENLAAAHNMDPEVMISDNNGDWFIDIPPGSVLELPTGQVGDEGIFDTDHPGFPFGPNTDPSLEDFLNYNEDSSSWRYDLVPKWMLDPLPGVSPVQDPNEYATFVDPELVRVSPVYKSDISVLGSDTIAYPVNALGWRRGLIAFKIIGVGADPDGSGSVLPNLILEIVDPSQIELDEANLGAGGVALVN